MRYAAILMILVIALATPVLAKQNKGTQKEQGARQQIKTERALSKSEQAYAEHRPATFSAAERNLIRARLMREEPPQSQAGKHGLPPGLQKKLARGKQLPPGWQKKVTPGNTLDYQVYRQGDGLPDDLIRRLPPSPIGSEIVRIENEIVRIDSATRTILDVFNLRR
jgi:hypothetical protein